MHTFQLRKRYYGLYNFKTDNNNNNNNVVASKSNSFLVQLKLLPSSTIQWQSVFQHCHFLIMPCVLIMTERFNLLFRRKCCTTT